MFPEASVLDFPLGAIRSPSTMGHYWAKEEPLTDFVEVWQRIVSHQRREFRMKSGRVIQYEVSGNTVFVSRTDKRQLSKSDFEKAWRLWPVEGLVKSMNWCRDRRMSGRC